MEDALNALLCGAVAITASCGLVAPWTCIFVGVGATIAYKCGIWVEYKLNIDDPVGAGAVHAFGGFWGLVALGLFADTHYLQEKYNMAYAHESLLNGDGVLLLYQFTGAVIIIVWALLSSVIAFGFMFIVPQRFWRRAYQGQKSDPSLMNFEGKLERYIFPSLRDKVPKIANKFLVSEVPNTRVQNKI